MAVIHILAHFDDEFCVVPLIRRAQAEGREQRFIHLVDYERPEMARRRHAESSDFLARLGLSPATELHLGAGSGWMDGHLYRDAPAVYARLKVAVAELGPVERIVAPAWEGGHPDHDVCAAMAAKLAAELGGVPVDAIALYSGKGLPGMLFRAATPLAENGAVSEIPIGRGEWFRWAALAACFPSQAKTWMGLLPVMTLTYMSKPAFRYQQLDPLRIGERPHAGSLLYERMFKVPYETVRRGVDALAADGHAPWRTA